MPPEVTVGVEVVGGGVVVVVAGGVVVVGDGTAVVEVVVAPATGGVGGGGGGGGGGDGGGGGAGGGAVELGFLHNLRPPRPDLDPVAVESEVDFEDSDLLSDDLLSVDLVSALVLSPDLVSLGFFEADCSPLVLASFGFSLPEFLKSVSYHPEPLSTKAAADTFFRRLSSPHSGQKTSGSSDIFCNASRWWSHETQAYS